MYTNPFFIFRL